MKLKFYNTLTKKKEDFVAISDTVKMYSCGPTVYHFAHIGNLRSYVFMDILARSLRFFGFSLKQVMNITDVGHLTSDADEGEDKMVKGAKREGKTVQEIADFYTSSFMKDLSKLNIISPNIICKASEHISQMIDMIKKIEENGFSYVSGGNVYFNTSKFESYGDFANLNLDNLKEGARVGVDSNKKNPSDFVLWFTKSKFSDQDQKWDSPWGVGYPGWHIECSAMSSYYLGEQFDIHTGGIDHIPVHHTNEIAQSEAAFGKHPWVNYWMHNEFLVVDKGKMSKSSGDFLTLAKVESEGYDSLAYRVLCLGANYRQQLSYSDDAMKGAEKTLDNIRRRIIALRNEDSLSKDSENKIKMNINNFREEFLEAIADDLNTPKALAVFQSVLRDDSLGKDRLSLLEEFDKILGIGISLMKEDKIELSDDEKVLLDKRSKAREEKNWVLSDEIRDKLKKTGLIVEDNKNGIKIRREK